MTPILTIGITSYNRVKELERCIRSIRTIYTDDIEILVSEDKSPLSEEIERLVEKIASKSKYHIRFTSNEVNLGYDMNLGSIIQRSNGQYVFLMSDDDAVTKGFIDRVIPFLKKNNKYGVVYAPFIHADSKKKDRVRGKKDYSISSGEKSAAKYIYDSILFSGLIFNKDFVKDYDSSRFKNHNYYQVYLFLQMLFKHGAYYFSYPSVLCIGDGENAYGLSESSKDDSVFASEERNAILANRKSVKSDLEFNKTLFKVIKMFDQDEGTHIFKKFERQYSLHSISGLTLARKEGTEYFKEYWNILNGLDIHLYPITKIYYILLLVFGAKGTTLLLSGFRRIAKKEK